MNTLPVVSFSHSLSFVLFFLYPLPILDQFFCLHTECYSYRNTEEGKKIDGGEAHGQKILVVNPASTAIPVMMTSGTPKKKGLLAGATDGATRQQALATVWVRWRGRERQRVCASWLARTKRSDK